jgi:hypothetical protein
VHGIDLGHQCKSHERLVGECNMTKIRPRRKPARQR